MNLASLTSFITFTMMLNFFFCFAFGVAAAAAATAVGVVVVLPFKIRAVSSRRLRSKLHYFDRSDTNEIIG